jgi:MtN3 and saliva related transmembrane protein
VEAVNVLSRLRHIIRQPFMVELVGYCAAVLTTVAFVPQVVKIWRSKSAADLSLPMLAAFTSGVVLWLIYGIALGSMPVIAANATTLALNLVLVGLKLRHGRSRP